MKQRNPNAKPARRQVVLTFGKPNGRAWHAPDPALPEEPKIDAKRARKAPGKRAQKHGTKLKGGAAVKVMCYPRAATKAMLVHASQMANRSLSSFMILASLKEAAAIKGVHVEDLIPPEEYEQYR